MRSFFAPSVLFLIGGIAVAGALRVEQSNAASTDVGTQIARLVSGVIGYSRWPTPPDTYRLCVAGTSTYFNDALVGFDKIGGHDWSIRDITVNDAAATANCDLLYLGAMTAPQKRKLLANTSGRPVLTISEDDPVCADASMFCLAINGDEVGLLANLDSISRSGIRINPKVLQLVRRKQVQQ